MSRTFNILILMAAIIVAVYLFAPVQGCPQYPPGQGCLKGHFKGPQWVFTGYNLTDIDFGSDGQIEKWGPIACCATCQSYIDDTGKKPCTAFTLYVDSVNTICSLKSKGIPTGEPCPDGQSCISGDL